MRYRDHLSLALAVVPSGLVLPVLSSPAANPRPVAAEIHRTLLNSAGPR
jgi:hypothetical protein